MYVEMTIEEALKHCNKNQKVLVAVQDLRDTDVNAAKEKKKRSEYEAIFEDIETVASCCDSFVKKLRLFTEKQNIYNIKPKGLQKTVLLKEW